MHCLLITLTLLLVITSLQHFNLHYVSVYNMMSRKKNHIYIYIYIFQNPNINVHSITLNVWCIYIDA